MEGGGAGRGGGHKSHPPLDKRKLYVVLLDHLLAQGAHTLRHIHFLKASIIRNTLEERNAVSWPITPPRAEDSVRRAGAYPAREGLHPLPNGDNKRPRDRHGVDPLAAHILRLKTSLRRSLEQVRCQHAIFMRANALAVQRVVTVRRSLGILYDLELVLLVFVKEAVEGRGAKADGLGNERREQHADRAELFHVLFEHGPEVRPKRCRGPLVRRLQVPVQWVVGTWHWLWGAEIQLLAVIWSVRRCFIVELEDLFPNG